MTTRGYEEKNNKYFSHESNEPQENLCSLQLKKTECISMKSIS